MSKTFVDQVENHRGRYGSNYRSKEQTEQQKKLGVVRGYIEGGRKVSNGLSELKRCE
jgi:hypothetical protein